MKTITLTDLIARVRARCDVRSNVVSDAVLTDWINQAIVEYMDVVISSNPFYFLSNHTFAITSGTNTYTLPADFYILHGASVLDSTNQWTTLKPFHFGNRHRLQNAGASRENTEYRIVGNSLMLTPTPSWSGSIKIWYIPVPTALTLGADTFDGVFGWDEYVILNVCIRCRIKQEEDYRGELILLQQQEKRIQNRAAMRDVGEPPKVRNVDHERLMRARPDLFLPRG